MYFSLHNLFFISSNSHSLGIQTLYVPQSDFFKIKISFHISIGQLLLVLRAFILIFFFFMLPNEIILNIVACLMMYVRRLQNGLQKSYLENKADMQTLKSFERLKCFQRLIFNFMHIQKRLLILFELKLVCTSTVSVFLSFLV